MPSTSSKLLQVSLGFFFLFGGACADADAPAAPLDFLQMLPTFKRVEVGESFQFGAERVLGASTANVTSDVSLRSDDEGVLRVEEGNVVKAVGAGTANVIAKYDGTEASAEVTVVAAVSAIELDVGDFSLARGTSKPLGAVLVAGDAKRVFDAGTWGSLDPAIASVDSDGLVTGQSAGETSITLSRRGLTTLQHVRVEELALASVQLRSLFGTKLVAGGTGKLKVEGKLGAGTQDLSALFEFALADDGDVLTVAGASVQAGDGGGTAKVVATGKKGSIAADQRAELEIEVVKASELQSVRVDVPAEVALGMEDIAFKILGDYGVGTELETAVTELTVEPAAAITIHGNLGTIVPLKVAEAELKALVTVDVEVEKGAEPETRDVTASQRLNVVDTPLSMLSVSLNSDGNPSPGQTLQLEATAHYGTLAQTVTQPALWTSADPTVAVVSNVHGGVVTALRPGSTKLQARYHEKSAEYDLVVAP